MNNFIHNLPNKFKQLTGIRNNTYPDPALYDKRSEFEVNNWVISDFLVNRLIPIVGLHPYPLPELQLMVATLCWLKPEYIFEWGTHRGVSARIFFETVQGFKLRSKIYSIDLSDTQDHIEHPHNERGMYVKNIPEVTLIQGDGLSDSISIYKNLKGEPKVLFFLDGDHSYKSVKRELDGIHKRIPNANYLVHDTFYQSDGSGYNTGPYRAVNEFMSSNKGKYRSLSQNTGLPGMSLLYSITS